MSTSKYLSRPIHRFLRNPNLESSLDYRIANRTGNMFENTMSKLSDPKTGRSLYLIGTTHASTQLAQRTQKLVSDLKPDSIYLQVNETWASKALKIQNVSCQEDFDNYNYILKQANDFSGVSTSIRAVPFFLRFYPWLATISNLMGFPKEFHPFLPGLEMKYALEEASKAGSKIHFGGMELDPTTMKGLYNESRMDLIPLLYKIQSIGNDTWIGELEDVQGILNSYGSEAFAESIDKFRANWFVKFFELIAPQQKKIIVDMKEVEMFKTLYSKLEGKTIVAVINQWHMSGIEEIWKSVTGTQEALEPINPVGDFDINEAMEGQLINDNLRFLTSRITKSEPATWSNYLTMYNKEPFESHRTRHISFDDAYDEHMYHGLPWDTHGHKVDPKIQYNIQPNNFDLKSQEGLNELKRLLKEQEKHLSHSH